MREDVDLLKSQAERCRDILASLSRMPEREGGQPFDSLPLTGLAEEAARDHLQQGVLFRMMVDDASSDAEPMVARSPEFLQGIGNIIQNAGQFADKAVNMTLYWSDREIRIRVADDGPGFPSWMIDSLGEPYLSTRAGQSGHMGLGLFIAQTLLGRIGADTTYGNVKNGGTKSRGTKSGGTKSGGAYVEVVWNRASLDISEAWDKPEKDGLE